MSQITAEELRSIAVILTQLSSEIAQVSARFRFSHPTEFNALTEVQQEIFLKAESISEEAVDIIVSNPEVQAAADRIKESTENFKDALQTIEDIGRILAIATAVLNLVTSIATAIGGNPLTGLASTLASLNALIDAI